MGEEIKYSTILPDGWVLLEFGETCEKVSLNGIKIKQKQYLVSGKCPVVDQGQDSIGGYFNDETFVVPGEPPYIVFGDHTKVKKYINFKFIAGADGVKVIRPYEYFLPKLFYHFLHCIKLPDKGYARHFQFLEKSQFPLPPLPEQHRIVAKIEELFSSLDKGIENLKTAQAQLKTYRQAVLKWAFEGKLTNENVKEGKLPEGWAIKKVSELSSVVRGGSPRPAGDPRFYNGNIPFLKVADLTKDNGVYLTQYKYTIKEAGLQKTRKIGSDTLLLTNSGATLGVPKICKISATMNDGVAAFLNLDKRSLLYLYYFWLSKTKELRTINQGAAQPNLNTEIIKKYEVPYCAFQEQHRIVSEIETRLSVCDKLEESITQSLVQAEALRQSILKKAFEGKLAPQDPSDLPAPQPGKWFVYVLECAGGTYCKGVTRDILERWKQHARGQGAEWTAKHPPVKLVHWEEFSSESAAVEREKELETDFGRKWLEHEIKAGRTRQAGEPASVLLERIRAERALVGAKKATTANGKKGTTREGR